ncbi:hypothetical protein HanPI659440_Chr05g0185941 [Helianthus annuus]|nr:hypothetical protein HanPI659440_Chr05g0185941 [Helianthus annuus]
MELEPNRNSDSDSEEKKDPKITEAMKEKAKGKRPMEEEEVALPSSDSDLEQITNKTGGIVINEVRSTTVVDASANASKGKALTGSERSKGKRTETVVKSSYSLRSRDKGVMDIDAKPTKGKRGKKRKGKELKRLVVESKERLKRRRDRDDDEKDDKGGTGAYATRSSTKKRKGRSL